MANEPVYVTVGFKCADRDAFNDFWKDIRETYRFVNNADPVPVQAFAVSMGDMFEEQDVIAAITGSSLTADEQVEAISGVSCVADLRKLCAEWGVAHPYAQVLEQ